MKRVEKMYRDNTDEKILGFLNIKDESREIIQGQVRLRGFLPYARFSGFFSGTSVGGSKSFDFIEQIANKEDTEVTHKRKIDHIKFSRISVSLLQKHLCERKLQPPKGPGSR